MSAGPRVCAAAAAGFSLHKIGNGVGAIVNGDDAQQQARSQAAQRASERASGRTNAPVCVCYGRSPRPALSRKEEAERVKQPVRASARVEASDEAIDGNLLAS